jgi:hypothetical protein
MKCLAHYPTRAEHLEGAKARAIACLQPRTDTLLGRVWHRIRLAVVPMALTGQLIDAWDCFVTELGKHPETKGHPAVLLGGLRMLDGSMRTAESMRDFIEGTH